MQLPPRPCLSFFIAFAWEDTVRAFHSNFITVILCTSASSSCLWIIAWPHLSVVPYGLLQVNTGRWWRISKLLRCRLKCSDRMQQPGFIAVVVPMLLARKIEIVLLCHPPVINYIQTGARWKQTAHISYLIYIFWWHFEEIMLKLREFGGPREIQCCSVEIWKNIKFSFIFGVLRYVWLQYQPTLIS